MNSFVGFINEVRGEIRKVSWPSWDELVGSTVIVLIVVAIVAVLLGVMDAAFTYVIRVLTS